MRAARGSPSNALKSMLASSSSSQPSTSSTAARRLAQIGQHMGMSSMASQSHPPAEAPVLFESEGSTRIYKMNRPKAYNALNGEMVDLITEKVKAWQKSEFCKVLLGVGDGKTFCSGGDVKAIALMAKEKRIEDCVEYFKGENELDYLLATFGGRNEAKCYIAIMDGMTMGGGAGLAYGAPLRVATPDTEFAMPETTIGFAPDVGAQFYLTQLDGSIGAWMAVTAQSVYGRAVYELGLATHYIPKASVQHLIHAIQQTENPTTASLASLISTHSAPPPSSEAASQVSSKAHPDAPSGLVGPVRVLLDKAFSKDSVPEIMKELETAAEESEDAAVKAWAAEQVAVMKSRSPTGMAVALAGFKRAQKAKGSLWSQLNNDLAMCAAFVKSPEQEMLRGVTARLIVKPREVPAWSPASIEDPSLSPENVTKEFFSREQSSLLKEVPTLGLGSEHSDNLAGKFREWGLPTEESIRKHITGEDKSSDAYALTEEELLDRLVNEAARRVVDQKEGKKLLQVGLREKVAEIVKRKCKVIKQDNAAYLQWK